MTTDAKIGHGSTFGRGNGADPEVFTDVAEVTSITPPGMARDAVEATHMDSPEKWREFIAGLKDGGEVSIECNFDPGGTDVTAWLGDINSDAVTNYKITFPDATEWDFAALMTGLEFGTPLDDKMTASMTYKVTGKPAFIS